MSNKLVLVIVGMFALGSPAPALAWGDEAHRIVAQLAAKVLEKESPKTLDMVNGLLGSDSDNKWSNNTIADEAVWADRYREKSADGRRISDSWHYVALDYNEPNLDKACEHPAFDGPASQGPSPDCLVNKIEQFKRVLADKQSDPDERLIALRYLLHLVGDVHQPLHTITRTDPDTGHNDNGGDCLGVLPGKTSTPIRLQTYWSTNLVQKAVSKDVDDAAEHLLDTLTAQAKKKWGGGSAADWARESYEVAKSRVYAAVIDHPPEKATFVFRGRDGKPDPRCSGPSKVYKIDPASDEQAKQIVKEQLAKAGLRLARLLKDAIK